MSTNLLDETVEFLQKYDKTLDDVLFIQGDDFEITRKTLKQQQKIQIMIQVMVLNMYQKTLCQLVKTGGLNAMSMMVLNGGSLRVFQQEAST